jgi:hypothetical protein
MLPYWSKIIAHFIQVDVPRYLARLRQVARVNRLTRSTLDLFAIVKSIVDRKAQFGSLQIRRVGVAVPGGLADVERDLIRARTSEGRERAKTRGVKLAARRSSLCIPVVLRCAGRR